VTYDSNPVNVCMKLIYFWLFLHFYTTVQRTTLKSSYVVATSVTVALRSTQPSLLLATCARLSWSHSCFWVHVKLSYRIVSYNINAPLTPMTSTFVSSSMRVRLNLALPPFIISLVSRPANRTRPKHQAVFRRTQPRRSTLSLSSECDLSRHVIAPSNLLNMLFGGSHSTSAKNTNRSEKSFKKI